MAGRDCSDSPSLIHLIIDQKPANDPSAEQIDGMVFEVRGISDSDMGVDASSEMLSALACTLQQTRRKIDQIFELEGFAISAACDVMLELFQARVRGAPVLVSALCQTMSCPPSVTQRWLDVLVGMHLVERISDSLDHQRVALTEEGYLKTAKVLQLHL